MGEGACSLLVVTPVCGHFGVTKQPHGVRDSSLTESDSGCRPEAMIKPSPPAMGHVMVRAKPTEDRAGTAGEEEQECTRVSPKRCSS